MRGNREMRREKVKKKKKVNLREKQINEGKKSKRG